MVGAYKVMGLSKIYRVSYCGVLRRCVLTTSTLVCPSSRSAVTAIVHELHSHAKCIALPYRLYLGHTPCLFGAVVSLHTGRLRREHKPLRGVSKLSELLSFLANEKSEVSVMVVPVEGAIVLGVAKARAFSNTLDRGKTDRLASLAAPLNLVSMHVQAYSS